MSKPNSVPDYIATFPTDIQDILRSIRNTILKAAPGAAEGISYQIPTYKQEGVLASFAAYKTYVGFYPTPSAISYFKEEIMDYKFAKGSVQFPISAPMPLDLIRRMVEFKLEENTGGSAK